MIALFSMLLLDDDDELPETPDEHEAALAEQLGARGLLLIDQTLVRCTRSSWLKSARVVVDSLEVGGFPIADDAHVALHVRRLIGLVERGVLEAQGISEDLASARFG